MSRTIVDSAAAAVRRAAAARCAGSLLVALAAGAFLHVGAAAAQAPRAAGEPTVEIPESLRGRSGRLRLHVLQPHESFAEFLPDTESPAEPSIIAVHDSLASQLFRFVTLVPLTEKQDGRVGVYRVGRWPAEVRKPRSEAYRAPAGFIQVHEADQSIPVSDHFTLGQFLTKDQRAVWPKFLVLDERLVDKLELIVSELRLMGHRAQGLTVLSGFRTPQYNARGKSAGLASDSRHQYGDAADVFVDADGDGRMDDLNFDGRIDINDALAFARIVDRVEAKYPELVGGVGLYRVVPGHGPFVHVDARGERARWGVP
ncbi:MAG: DUF882 domain-containing protein [Gemmatimonadetes bacterium]|nr:DUF882 domain-containing protein [Gemmatimonadota bacterium]